MAASPTPSHKHPRARHRTGEASAVPLARLAPGVVLDRDVTTATGAVLVKAGAFVSPTLVTRLRRISAVIEPIYVRPP